MSTPSVFNVWIRLRGDSWPTNDLCHHRSGTSDPNSSSFLSSNWSRGHIGFVTVTDGPCTDGRFYSLKPTGARCSKTRLTMVLPSDAHRNWRDHMKAIELQALHLVSFQALYDASKQRLEWPNGSKIYGCLFGLSFHYSMRYVPLWPFDALALTYNVIEIWYCYPTTPPITLEPISLDVRLRAWCWIISHSFLILPIHGEFVSLDSEQLTDIDIIRFFDFIGILQILRSCTYQYFPSYCNNNADLSINLRVNMRISQAPR